MGIKSTGLADGIIKIINDAGIKTVTYDGVQADPPDWSVNEAGEIGIKEKVDGVVGVGRRQLAGHGQGRENAPDESTPHQ
jgi:alcohol dehydrogenase class IV